MRPEQWQKIHELFEAALERPADERAAFLARACAGDEETERRVGAMIAADARDDLLLDRPAYQAASPLVPSMLGPDHSQSRSVTFWDAGIGIVIGHDILSLIGKH